MALLSRRLAQRFFPDFVAPIKAAHRPGVWRFAHSSFPFVAVTVFDDAGTPLHGLVLNAESWPLRPPRVTPTTPDFRTPLAVKDVRRRLDGNEAHIYDDAKRPGQGAYFCVEGTWEFHEDYARAVPWDDVRRLSGFQPDSIVDHAVALIDRRAGVA